MGVEGCGRERRARLAKAGGERGPGTSALGGQRVKGPRTWAVMIMNLLLLLLRS